MKEKKIKENSKQKKIESKLNDKLEVLQKEKDELFEQLQRVSADYANYQKRAPKQIADSIAYEKEKVIKSLLPALDNFEHTLQNASSAESIDVLVKGIRIVYDQMLDILKSHGVIQIEALGENFDPSMHQAMMRRSESEKEENIVLEEFQKGYKLNDRIIRPSQVIVNKLPVQERVAKEDEGKETDTE